MLHFIIQALELTENTAFHSVQLSKIQHPIRHIIGHSRDEWEPDCNWNCGKISTESTSVFL